MRLKSDFERIEIANQKKDILLSKGREKQKEAGKLYGEKHSKQEVLSESDKTSENQKHNTRNQVAENLGWSTGKVAKAEIVNRDADEETKENFR